MSTWGNVLEQCGVPHDSDSRIAKTLADPVKVRNWHLHGLPTDELSVENGIAMSITPRWPLLIDPQGQANRYIKNMGKAEMGDNMDIIKMSDKNYLRALENGVRYGKWVLMENIGEKLEASINPILLKQTFRQGSATVLRIGDNVVPYDSSFRFFMTTKLPNPHYRPEISVMVTILNFAITPGGLEEQLLGVLIEQEQPDIAAKKSALVVANVRMEKELTDTETRILMLLKTAEGNILDNVEVIEALDEAKAASVDVARKCRKPKRRRLRLIAVGGVSARRLPGVHALLLCCRLAKVDPMYQYSLLWYTNLFIQSIKESGQCRDGKASRESQGVLYAVSLRDHFKVPF